MQAREGEPVLTLRNHRGSEASFTARGAALARFRVAGADVLLGFANVVAAELGDAQGIVVDTHVRRLSQRLGLTRNEDPVKIERDLVKLVPRGDWARFAHLVIWHGRRVCDARRPRCEECLLADLCPSSRVGVEPGAW